MTTTETLAIIGVGVGVALLLFLLLPKWRVSRLPPWIPGLKRIELEDKARATVAQFLGSAGLIATVAVALFSVNQARVAADRSVDQARDATARALDASRLANASDRFDRAVKQLEADTGKGPDQETRLGAIYTLQQYASSFETREARQDAVETTAAILAAYVRTNSPVNAQRSSNAPLRARSCDIDAGFLRDDVRRAIAAMNRIVAQYHRFDRAGPEIAVDLSGSDLRDTKLSGVRIASLASSDISGATLDYVDIRDTNLANVTALKHTCLAYANLPINLPGFDPTTTICAPVPPVPGGWDRWKTRHFVTADKCPKRVAQ